MSCLQVAEDDYGQLVERENINREEAGVNASGLEAAVAALVVGDSTPEDRHPEKYVFCLAASVLPCRSCTDCVSKWGTRLASIDPTLCRCLSQRDMSSPLLDPKVRGAVLPTKMGAFHACA